MQFTISALVFALVASATAVPAGETRDVSNTMDKRTFDELNTLEARARCSRGACIGSYCTCQTCDASGGLGGCYSWTCGGRC